MATAWQTYQRELDRLREKDAELREKHKWHCQCQVCEDHDRDWQAVEGNAPCWSCEGRGCGQCNYTGWE